MVIRPEDCIWMVEKIDNRSSLREAGCQPRVTMIVIDANAFDLAPLFVVL